MNKELWKIIKKELKSREKSEGKRRKIEKTFIKDKIVRD